MLDIMIGWANRRPFKAIGAEAYSARPHAPLAVTPHDGALCVAVMVTGSVRVRAAPNNGLSPLGECRKGSSIGEKSHV